MRLPSRCSRASGTEDEVGIAAARQLCASLGLDLLLYPRKERGLSGSVVEDREREAREMRRHCGGMSERTLLHVIPAEGSIREATPNDSHHLLILPHDFLKELLLLLRHSLSFSFLRPFLSAGTTLHKLLEGGVALLELLDAVLQPFRLEEERRGLERGEGLVAHVCRGLRKGR